MYYYGICAIINFGSWIAECGCGGMADAQDSKSCVGDYVWVQVPSSAVADLCLTEIQ